MNPHRCLSLRMQRLGPATGLARPLAAAVLLLATAAQAQTVYRCGNSYGTAPCPGGQAVAVDDARSDAQRQQGLAVQRQEAELARALARERRQREREQAALARLAPAGIGPTAAERRRLEEQAAQAAKKPKADHRRHPRRTKPAPVPPPA